LAAKICEAALLVSLSIVAQTLPKRRGLGWPHHRP
jgi:hypothetical protein